MPTFTRWCIKTAFLYFTIAVLIFAVLLWSQVLTLPPVVAALRPVAYHLLMVGWASQLIFGIVFWMFPRLSKEQPRGNERAAWFVYAALNSGLLLRLLAHPDIASKESVVRRYDHEVQGGTMVKPLVGRYGDGPGDATVLDIIGFARKRLGPAVAPREVEVVTSLPHTRSGKTMRRLLKARELGLPEGDLSTLEAPT